jgi:hypothetical protein
VPLPPLRPSQPEHSTNISEFCIDSIPYAEGEISASSTSVLESISSHHHYNFRFGNFHHTILDSKVLIPLIIPQIDVSTIEIGEIICFLKSENSQFKSTDEYMQSKNLDFATSESTGISSVLEIAPSCFKDYGNIDAVSVISDIRFFELNSCINEFKKFVMKIDVLWSAENDFVASSMIKCNNAVSVTFSQYIVPIFDPGGVIEPLSVMILRGEITVIICLKITFCLRIVFIVEFSGEFVVLVFDPGGNQLTSVFGELLI